jgi:hypothetical protein
VLFERWLRTNNDWQSCIQGQEAKGHLAELDPPAPLAADCVIDSLPVLGPGDQALLIEQNNETPKALKQWGDSANRVEMWLYHELKPPEGKRGSK